MVYRDNPVASVVIGLICFTGLFALASTQSVFQVVSIITTTGLQVTLNYEPLQRHLFLLMFIGGCGGSTAGSMKAACSVFSSKHKEVTSSVNPNVVRVSKLNGAPIKPQV